MEQDDRTEFTEKLAERGLEIHSFDGHALRLRYNSAADHLMGDGPGADEEELAGYAKESLAGLPEAAHMFPGLDRIVVEFGAI
jgi:hypothetical protein